MRHLKLLWYCLVTIAVLELIFCASSKLQNMFRRPKDKRGRRHGEGDGELEHSATPPVEVIQVPPCQMQHFERPRPAPQKQIIVPSCWRKAAEPEPEPEPEIIQGYDVLITEPEEPEPEPEPEVQLEILPEETEPEPEPEPLEPVLVVETLDVDEYAGEPPVKPEDEVPSEEAPPTDVPPEGAAEATDGTEPPKEEEAAA